MNPILMPEAAVERDEAARWHAWERDYRNSNHRAAVAARIAFAILLTGTVAWLGIQLLSLPV
jgi:hypothetical protein